MARTVKDAAILQIILEQVFLQKQDIHPSRFQPDIRQKVNLWELPLQDLPIVNLH
jgi:hypothetical protein